jgi:hypothetical protein
MRFLTLVFALLISSVAALAADVSGAWAVTVDSPNGPLEVTLTLKQDGDKLTGTVSSQMGDAPITGTVKGDDIEFTMSMDAGGQNMVIKYNAKVDGDKISGSLDFAGQGEIKFAGTKKTA